tara:strand:- start:193 stop:1227 length:1035 start_codon:yes stop_codon:yes gene_type:complete
MAEAKITVTPGLNATINPPSTVKVGTVTAIRNAQEIGLGNVTNESKATMFTDPTFTGSITGTLGTAAQPNIRSVGNLTTLTVATDGSSDGKVTCDALDADAFKVVGSGGGISYNTNAFTVDTNGDTTLRNLVSSGYIQATGTIKSTSYEAADFPNTSTARTTAAFKEDGTLVQDDKIIVKRVTGAEAQAMTTTPSSFIEIIPAPGANKVIVVRELELFIDRGSWSPMSGGQVRGWGDHLTVVIKTPSSASGQQYNTYATFMKGILNHQFGATFNPAHAVDVLLVRDAPALQTRAYPNVPLLLRPNSALTYNNLATYGQTVDDDYYIRVQYAIRDLTTDFAVTTT